MNETSVGARRYFLLFLLKLGSLCVVSSIILVIICLVIPKMALVMGLFLAAFLFYSSFQISFQPWFFHEILLASVLAFFLLVTFFLQNSICHAQPEISVICQPNNLRAQHFSNIFSFGLGLLISWLLIRLPILIRTRAKRQS